MTTVSLRIDSNLAKQAEREARVENRSKAKQLEYWAKLGRVISSKLNFADAVAIAQGLKEIKLEVTQIAQSIGVDPDIIFNDLESDRKVGILPQKVTSAKVYYEKSLKREGYLDRVNSVTGKRQTGQFENGQFRTI